MKGRSVRARGIAALVLALAAVAASGVADAGVARSGDAPRPGSGSLDCDHFETQDQAQDAFEASGPGDPNMLDRDGDGIACEGLPAATEHVGSGCREGSYRGFSRSFAESRVEFKAVCRNERPHIVRFLIRSMLIRCRGGAFAWVGEIAFRHADQRVNDAGEFSFDSPKLTIDGKLVGRRTARGVFEFAGLVWLDGEQHECTSGIERWRAAR